MESATYTFEGVCVDRRRLLITRDGIAVSVEPKALDVLLFLIDHRDRLVTKEELLDAVWKDTFVTPNVLTRAVAQLRKAMGDEADRPRIIETAAKRGYRFIAPVEESSALAPLPPAPPVTDLREAGRRRMKVLFIAAGILLLAAAASLLMVQLSKDSPGDRPSPISVTPKRVSTRSGYESHPALSADGRSLAFVSDRTGSLEIYVRGLINAGADTALTSDEGNNTEPSWSPDGQWIAYHSQKHGGIWIVPATGGRPHQIVDFGSQPSWAPDSDRIVFVSASGGFNEQSTIRVVRRDGTGLQEMTKPSQTPGGALRPAWSQNGKFIAFTSGSLNVGGSGIRAAVLVLTVADGTMHEIADGPFQGSPEFGPNDKWLYWTRWGPHDPAILRAPLDAAGGRQGPIETVLPLTDGAAYLSMSLDGTLAYSILVEDANLWSLPLAPDGKPGEPVRLTNDAVRNTHPIYGPDGKIAFQQAVAGRGISVWILNEKGQAEMLLQPGQLGSDPQWSTDGKRIFVRLGESAAWVDLATRRVTPVPVQMEQVSFPRLSPDDQHLAYHRIGTDGKMRVFVRPLNGGPEHLVADDREGVGFPIWSSDGRQLAVEMQRRDQTIFGVVPVTGGPITEVVTERGNSWPHAFSRDDTRIAYAGQRDGVWNLFEVSRRTRASRPLTRFTLPIGYVRYPSWSPKGDRLLFERAIATASIWTMKVEANE